MALRKARAAVASSPEVESAASEVLGKGNAVDAVVAGVFAACAMSPGVLLGPVQILMGGAGAGLLAVDGRVRQPGIGAPRPRGFQSGEEIPDAARVGVPWLPAALSVAIATMGSATFNQVLGPGVSLAKGTARAEVLARIQSRGARGIEERPLGGELLAMCGRAAGGLLTSEDLAAPRPDVQKATRTKREDRVFITLPWANLNDAGLPTPPAHQVEVARVRSVMAVDRHGTFALACWDESTDGLLLQEVGLRAPFFAEPVRRGETRIRPGDVRAAAAPLLITGAETPEMAIATFGASDAYDVLAQAVSGLGAERIEARGEARLVVLSHANQTASVLRS